jgi:fido (protein-threonine AMPylation protein)
MTTESALKNWRYGQTQAERLVSALLQIEGFESVDPQHPLGGPDGTKDLLCRKRHQLWVAAAYFPTTEPSFNEITDKYRSDFSGVAKNTAEGLAFFCNQHLTVGQRQKLIEHAGQTPTEIYHLERIRGILDAPKGCGVRLEYLRIAMTEEEQWAFWSSMNQDVVRKLAAHEAERNAQFSSIERKLDLVLARTNAIGYALVESRSHLERHNSFDFELPTSTLSLGTVCWIHRVITEGQNLPETSRGQIRGVNVWVGSANSSPETATFIPVPPEQIIGQAESLFAWWRDQHAQLRTSPKDEIVAALAELHHGFLKIHPFLDANGRVALVILDQASRELLSQGIGPEFTRTPEIYYDALRQADAGNITPLVERILASLQ